MTTQPSLAMNLQLKAEQTLALMQAQGFDAAMVEASDHALTEVSLAHDQATLKRGTQRQKLSLLGLLDGRRASTELGDLRDEAVALAVQQLLAAVRAAPQDAANAVSQGQQADILQGPQQADPAQLADAMAHLLAWRAAHTPSVTLEEAYAAHHLQRSHVLTSAGSSLRSQLGWYDLMAMGTAREGERSSSFAFADGSCHALDDGLAPAQRFGIGAMMGDLVRQVHTQPLAQRFVGDVDLSPGAVASLIGWLRGQLADMALISGNSLYLQRVGEQIASPLLSLHSRFDAPGIAALSIDGFATPPVDLLRGGRLMTLTPSLYGSRKTGLPQVPLASGGWAMPAGADPLAAVVAGVTRGALVGRLSMGMPAANGNFSAVIKNSFLIEGGRAGPALAEVMITGNMAQMLLDVVVVSQERLDTGATLLPWLRIAGLHFS